VTEPGDLGTVGAGIVSPDDSDLTLVAERRAAETGMTAGFQGLWKLRIIPLN